jgi:hypothetical protein
VQFSCVTLWKIWYFRNQVIFQQGNFEPIEVAASVLLFVQDFNHANPIVSASIILRPPQVWVAPPPNFLKANIDAGRDQHGKVTWGLVIRNNKEEVVYAAMERADVVAGPVLAEALGLRWGMLLVRRLHLRNVMFELDASVVNCFNGLLHITNLEPFIKDCLELSTSLNGWSVVYVNRLCNIAAHELAQAAKTLGSRAWMGNAPLQV